MISKTALLSGVAGAFLIAGSAMAQDMPADPMTETPAEATQAQEDGSVAPGAEVRAADGASLGILEGAGVDASGQQTLQIRGSDGQLREAPIAGASLDNGAVVLTWSEAEFQAAPSVTDSTANVSGAEAPLPGDEIAPDYAPEPEPEAVTEEPEAFEGPEA